MTDTSSETLFNAQADSAAVNDTAAYGVINPCAVPSWLYALLCLMMAFTVFCCIFFVKSVLGERNLRNQGYNLYLVFLIMSDALFSIALLTEGIVVIATDCNGVNDISTYGFFISVFYYMANLTLNAVVAYEVHTMVRNSYNRQRTPPPSSKRVCLQAAVCYIWALWGAIWFRIGEIGYHLGKPVNWALVSYDENGIPHPGSEIIPAPVALAFILGAMFIPIIYVFYVGCSIRKILPRSGRTRALSLYFMRILIVFFLFYIPNMMIGLVMNVMKPPNIVQAIFIVLGWIFVTAQALVTIYMASQKDDIKHELANGLSTIVSSIVVVRSSLIGMSERTSQAANAIREDPRTDDAADAVAKAEGESTHSNSVSEVIPVTRRISKWDAEDVYSTDPEVEPPPS